MRTEWYSIAAVILSLTMPRQTAASGICTAARFRDWQDMGCPTLYAGLGGPAAPAPCSDCGMPRWWVSEPYINLHLSDTPLSYTLSSGKEMDFTFYYRQRAKLMEADEVTALPTLSFYDIYPTVVNCGTNASWGCNWNMSILLWDPAWESSWTPFGNNEVPPASYPVYSRGYQALVMQPEGGITYYDVTAANQNNCVDARSLVRLASAASGLNYPVVTAFTDAYGDQSNPPLPDANGVYWGNDGMGLKLINPDGSQEVFGLTPVSIIDYAQPSYYSTAGTSETRLLLTQRVDAQGRVTRLGYDYITNTSPYGVYYFRLHYVVDPDGRTNTFNYSSGLQVSEIDDPYGRKTRLTYTTLTGDMTAPGSIIDAAGLTNSFSYAGETTNGWMTSLTTPYGVTRFLYYQQIQSDLIDGYQQRAIYVQEPEGAQQLYYYDHNNPTEVGTNVTPSVPGQSFDDGNAGSYDPSLIHRNSYHWGRRQFTALAGNYYFNEDLSAAMAYQTSYPSYSQSEFAGALTTLTQNDFNKADLKHWLLSSVDNASITESLSSERAPSPDAAGAIPGLRTWYNYAGKPSGEPEELGSDPQITCLARVLPDGGSQYTTYYYYPIYSIPGFPAGAGFVSSNATSYTKSDGTIGVLTTWFQYAANSVDLLTISNSAGQFVNYGYNGSHQITTATNSLNQVTTLSWDASTHNLTGVQLPAGKSYLLNYYAGATPPTGTSALLQELCISPEGRAFTNNSYAAGLPTSVTDDRGVTVTHSWDSLNRLTGTVFPDHSSISNIYTRLDLTDTKDREGHWTHFAYDGLQHLTNVVNANNAVTSYSYCGCGSLNEIIDALTNHTYLNYDNQGNLTNVEFPDFSSLTWQYDLAGRMTNVMDGAGRWLTFGYNNQGLVTNVSSANGCLRAAIFDALNRPISVTDANGVTVTNAFDALGELLTRTWSGSGGGALAAETFDYSAAGLVAYTNRDGKATHYGLDGAGRITSVTNANLEVTQFAYDSFNHITSLIDGLQHQTTWQYNEYGWLTNKMDGLNRNALRYAYNTDGWLTNRWTPEKGNTGYTYDNVGNLKSILYPNSSVSYSYDLLNRLTNMVDAVGSHSFGWTPTGQLQSENDGWTTLSYNYVQGLRTALTISQSGGNWTQSYDYDAGWRMTNTVSLAGAFNYQFLTPNSYLPTSIALPSGAEVVNSYDSLARLKETDLNNYWGHTLDGYTYQRDPLGLVTNIVRNFGLTTNSVSVGYDNIGQTTSWIAREFSGVPRWNEQLGFGYDAAHNLHTRNNSGLTQTFTTDAANQLNSVSRSGNFTLTGATPAPATSVTVNGQAAQLYSDLTFARTNLVLADGPNTFTNIAVNSYGVTVTNVLTVNLPQNVNLGFDNNGSLTNDGAKLFGYDSENQLTNVTVVNRLKKDFVYDGLNRLRIKREYGWIGGTWSKTNEARYVWDGNDVVQLRDSNNVPTLTLTRGLDLSGSLHGTGGIGGLLAMTDGAGASYFPHQDALGSVTALMDAYENVAGRREMDAFGRTIALSGSKTGVNPFWHGGQLHDEDTDVYSYWRRAYLPTPGRFSTQDPLQEWGSGPNLYPIAGNDPINTVDLFGLEGNPFSSTLPGLSGRWNSDPFGGGGSFYNPGLFGPPPRGPDPLYDTLSRWQQQQQEADERFHREHPDLAFLADALQLGASVEMGKGEVPCPAKGQLFRHYGYAEDASKFENGLKRGAYATQARGRPMNGATAQDKLALPHEELPNAYYNVRVGPETPIIGPNPVRATGVPPRTGGGVEYTFPQGTPPGSVEGPFPIK